MYMHYLVSTVILLAAAATAQEITATERILGKDKRFQITLPLEPHRYADPLARAPGPRRRGRGDNTPGDNPITDAGATLGRVLFYDKRLSATNKVACASCHRQQHAFGEPTRVSTGIHSRKGKRNSPSLVNVRYHRSGRFFWDERAGSLEQQVLMPIQDRREMGMTIPALVQRLAQLEDYQVLCEEAFGDPEISADRIARALAQFVRSLTSFESRFDQAYEQAGSIDADFDDFTAEENLGKKIFFEGSNRSPSCASCHGSRGRGRGGFGDVFSSSPPHNIGLDRKTGKDRGVGAITGREDDDGKFKAPSLRNIEVSAPYMHDGRFATLEEVVEHYSSGVQAHPNLTRRLAGRRGRGFRGLIGDGSQPRGMGLDKDEIEAVVALLKTLTDRKFLADPRFSDPFR